MKCTGDTGVGIESFKDITVGVDSSEEVSEDGDGFDEVDEDELREVLETRRLLDCEAATSVHLPRTGADIVGQFRKQAQCESIYLVNLRKVFLTIGYCLSSA